MFKNAQISPKIDKNEAKSGQFHAISKTKKGLYCPSCSQSLRISELSCQDCNIEIRGVFHQSPFALLNQDDQAFLLEFVLQGGSLKKMTAFMNKSYPTVRKKLDNILEQLQVHATALHQHQDKKRKIVKMVQEGRMSAEVAAEVMNNFLT